MGYDLRMPYNFAGGLGLGTDFSSMMGSGGLGATGLGGDVDFPSLLRNMFPQTFTSSYQPTAPAQIKPEERAEKVKELDKKIEAAKAEVIKEEKTQTEKTDEKKAIEEKKFGFWDGVKSVGKGAVGIVTDMFTTKDEKGERHFSLGKTVLTAGVAALAIGATILCPPLGVALAVGGAAMSGVQVVKGISDASSAKTYADKDAATQEIAQGAVGGLLSVLGFKGANALKAAKTAKAAEGLTGTTKVLTTAAKTAATTTENAEKAAFVESMVSTVIKEEGLSRNTKLAELISSAVKKGEAIDFPDLTKVGITSDTQKIKIMGAVNEATNAAKNLNIAETTKDVELIAKVDAAVKTISNKKAGLKVMKNATQKLGDLLNLTEKDGLSAEVVAELSKVKASPQYGQLLGASGNRAALAARGRTINGIQNEEDIITTLKGLTNVSDKDKPVIEEVITILEQLKKTGAGKEQVKTALGKLLSEEMELTGEGMLQADVAEALRALKPTMTDRAISAAEHTKDGVYYIGRGVKKVATHPFTQTKDFGLKVVNADNFFAQVSNQANEYSRRKAQGEKLEALDTAIKAQADVVTKAKNARREKLEELAEIYGVSVRDDKHELKTDTQLIKEINKAKDKEISDKNAKAAVEKAKAN